MNQKRSEVSIIADHVVKRSLILAGGGIRMSYQVGVLQALAEDDIRFDHIDGTSGGIFNTAMLASGLLPMEMSERWRKLNISGFMSATPLKNYLKVSKMTAFGDADGIKNKVFPALGINIDAIRTNQLQSTFNVCNFSDKTVEAIAGTDVTTDHLIAGVSLPIFMPAIHIHDQWYSDAVWIKDANLMEAVKRGAEEIWLVWAIGNTQEYLPGSFNQYVHMIEMSANGGLLEEFEQIKLVNQRILAGDSPYGQKLPIKIYVIKPQFPLPLDPDLFLKKIDARALINIGYSDGKKYLKSIPPSGDPIDKSASRMNEPGRVFSFSHHYKGFLDSGDLRGPVHFYPYFTSRKFEETFSFHFYSSIFFTQKSVEVSTYNNSFKFQRSGKKPELLLEADFRMEGKTYRMKTIIELHQPSDWLLGLEFKRILFEIHSDDESTATTYLYQETFDRLRALARSKVNNYQYNGNGKLTKFKFIKKLYEHEV